MAICVPLVFGAPLIHATFVARSSQFLVEAQLEERLVLAHMADRGRLKGLLYPGARLLLAPRNPINRKTAFQVAAVYAGTELVSLDTLLPNRLVLAALEQRALPQFAHYTKVQREVSFGAHRFDFWLGEGRSSCILEVKSVGQVVDDVAMFPDAPTERGRRQVDALTEFAYKGQRSAILFIIQRSTGQAFVPDEQIDPLFTRALRRAITAGVEVYAYRCPITPEGISLGEHIPIYSSRRAMLLQSDSASAAKS